MVITAKACSCSRCNSLKTHLNKDGDTECSTCGHIERVKMKVDLPPRDTYGTVVKYFCKECGKQIRIVPKNISPDGNYCRECKRKHTPVPDPPVIPSTDIKLDIVWGYMVASQGQDDKLRAKRLIEITDYLRGSNHENS